MPLEQVPYELPPLFLGGRLDLVGAGLDLFHVLGLQGRRQLEPDLLPTNTGIVRRYLTDRAVDQEVLVGHAR